MLILFLLIIAILVCLVGAIHFAIQMRCDLALYQEAMFEFRNGTGRYDVVQKHETAYNKNLSAMMFCIALGIFLVIILTN